MRVQAVRLVAHGAPLQVDEVEIGPPGPDEVVVDMAYAGVNPVDRYGAEGRVAPNGPVPRTMGMEGSGTAAGRPVVVHGHGLGTARDGVWSTSAVVPRAALVEIPDGVDLRAAAGMGVAGVTAWRTVDELARVGAEDRVLVLGASGGVGSIAVSIAAASGATVWGQTGDESKCAWIVERGAARAIVCDAGGLAELASALEPTVVVDPLGGGFTGASIAAIAAHGRHVLFGTSAGPVAEVPLQTLYRKGVTLYGYGGLIETDDRVARGVREALGALRDGRLSVPIDSVVPLAGAGSVFDRLARRSVTGKIVLDLQG